MSRARPAVGRLTRAGAERRARRALARELADYATLAERDGPWS